MWQPPPLLDQSSRKASSTPTYPPTSRCSTTSSSRPSGTRSRSRERLSPVAFPERPTLWRASAAQSARRVLIVISIRRRSIEKGVCDWDFCCTVICLIVFSCLVVFFFWRWMASLFYHLCVLNTVMYYYCLILYAILLFNCFFFCNKTINN